MTTITVSRVEPDGSVYDFVVTGFTTEDSVTDLEIVIDTVECTRTMDSGAEVHYTSEHSAQLLDMFNMIDETKAKLWSAIRKELMPDAVRFQRGFRE